MKGILQARLLESASAILIAILHLFATQSRVYAQAQGPQKSQSAPLSDLILLRTCPDPVAISNITLLQTLPASQGGLLDEKSFRALLWTATPISPDVAKGLAFAPWYNGSFVIAAKTNSFALFLGGIGLLSQPDNTKGLFAFDVGNHTGKVAAVHTEIGKPFTAESEILGVVMRDQEPMTRILKQALTVRNVIDVLTTYRRVSGLQFYTYDHGVGSLAGTVQLKGGRFFIWEIEPNYAARITDKDGNVGYFLAPNTPIP